MTGNVLTLNGGSSSLKFAVYRIGMSGEKVLMAGAVEAIGAEQGRFRLRDTGATLIDRTENFPDDSSAAIAMFAALKAHGLTDFAAAGHRVVHGGRYFCEPHRVDTSVIRRLRELAAFAPLHVPRQIALMEAVWQHYPDLPQVACFDTSFHARMPEIARRFALPRDLWDQGVMRYGFHGLSYEYVLASLGRELGSRAIIAHLGNGASMVALKDGQPVDTSMGLTPTGGFMMGTRSGDLDPGVLLYLLRSGWKPEQLSEVLDHQSGLLGVSGISADMKTLMEKREQNADAEQAVQMFCYQVRKFIGSYAAVLKGLDTLVFTGGIGERAAEVRAEIVEPLAFLGIELDGTANNRHSSVISAPASRCSVRVMKTDEDLMIARHTARVISSLKM